jgi:hypothetical protein
MQAVRLNPSLKIVNMNPEIIERKSKLWTRIPMQYGFHQPMSQQTVRRYIIAPEEWCQ